MGFNQHSITTRRTQILAEYIASAQFNDFPTEVVERAKLLILQVVGEALAASPSEQATKAIALANYATGGTEGTASIWGINKKVSMENAAMANGVFANLNNWEKCPFGLPACGAIPTAWAVAEAQGQTGKELITAIVVGYEVYLRVASAVQLMQEKREETRHGATSWQIFAALVPALKLMKLDSLQINKGLSMGTVCSVIPANFYKTTGSDSFHFEYGFRNQTAVTLAVNARRGTENLEDAFDDASAYAVHFTQEEKPEWYTKELGKTYFVLSETPQRNPIEIKNNFKKLVSSVFPPKKTEELLMLLLNIENCTNISAISKWMTQ